MSIITREFKVKAKGLKFPEGPISMNESFSLAETWFAISNKIALSTK